jgi:hypothetical protein
MAGDKRTGPQDTTPEARPNVKVTGTALDAASVATPMRRRREAAWRLPVLASGHHDPLDEARRPIRRPGRCARAVLTANGTWRPCCGRGAA